MACLMVMGGGHRGDVIKNMMLEEWNDRITETGPNGRLVRMTILDPSTLL